MLHLILYGRSWLGLEPYDDGCMCFASIVQFMKMRSLVLARDDVPRALVQSGLCKVNASRLAR